MTVLITNLSLEPGDKVRLKEYEFISWDPWYDMTDLMATKGSTGVVVSIEEYLADCERTHEKPSPYAARKPGSDYYSEEPHYPIRFEKVEKAIPLSGSPNTQIFVKCRAGDIGWVRVKTLEKLDYLNETTLFILERVRVVFQEEDYPIKVAQGYKLLLVDFALENQHNQTIAYTSPSPRIWLTDSNAPEAAQPGDRIYPFRVDLPVQLDAKQRRSGQLFFQVPERGSTYRLHLELDPQRIGAVVRVINVLDLRPGDAVRLRRTAHAERYGSFQSFSVASPWWMSVTGGSYGVIVTFAQFQKAYEQRLKQFRGKLTIKDQEDFVWGCTKARREMEECLAYPVLITKVVPPSAAELEYAQGYDHGVCQGGEIVFIRALALKQLPVYKPEPAFFTTRVQVITPDDDYPLRPEEEHKLLIIDFAFQHPDTNALPASPAFHLRLTYTSESASPSTDTIQPVCVELAGKDQEYSGKLSGQVTFQVPRNTFAYELGLEITSLGQWKKSIQVSPWQAGDKVFQTHGRIPGKEPGTIISFKEYCLEYDHWLKEQVSEESKSNDIKLKARNCKNNFPAIVKEKIESGLGFPVRFDQALVINRAPVHNTGEAIGEVIYEAGYIEIVSARQLARQEIRPIRKRS
jgi:hypothetical protein